LQEHELVAGPVDWHVAFASQAPLLMSQELIEEHTIPVPE
jgi:hypothetical protein